MDFPERLKLLIKKTGLSVDLFAGEVDMSRAQIYNYLKGGNEPTAAFFKKVKQRFPWISLEWFVADIGEMSISKSSVSQVAKGNGNIQVGNSGSVSIGNQIREQDPPWAGGKVVRVSQVVEILKDYVSPKIIKEIEERLKEET